MNQLFQEALSSANIFYTILLGFVMLYWLTVFIGALDLDFLDFDLDKDFDLNKDFDLDLDIDADVDVDVDADVDADTDVDGASAGWFTTTLSFFNLGKVPFMIFLSLLVLTMWVLSVVLNFYFIPDGQWNFLILFVPILLVGALFTKVLSSPFKGLHRGMNQEGTKKRELVGKIGKVVIGIRPGKMGRVQLRKGDETFFLDVFSQSEQTLDEGSQALIVEYNPKEDTYLVEPFHV